MAPKFENFQPSRTIVRIDSVDGTGIDIGTMEYAVSFGGAKDDVGAIIVARPNGLVALIELLYKLSISAAEIDIALRVLTTEPSHTIQDVTLTREVLRSLGI